MFERINQYETAECLEISRACDGILGEKPLYMYDTIVGDPDMIHRPQEFADGDE